MYPCSVHLLVPPYSPLIPVAFPPWKKTKQSKQLRKQKKEQQLKKSNRITTAKTKQNKTAATTTTTTTKSPHPKQKMRACISKRMISTWHLTDNRVSHPFLTFASQWLRKFLDLDVLFIHMFKHRTVNNNTQVLPQFLSL